MDPNPFQFQNPRAKPTALRLRAYGGKTSPECHFCYSSGTYSYMAHTDLTTRSRVEAKGRVVIPASFRSALGLKVGDEIELRIEDNEIRISTLQSRLARSRARLRTFVKPGRLLSDELIAERRRAALLE